jgi:uncharacterized protein YkwD
MIARLRRYRSRTHCENRDLESQSTRTFLQPIPEDFEKEFDSNDAFCDRSHAACQTLLRSTNLCAQPTVLSAKQILEYINRERHHLGLDPFRSSSVLNCMAERHARHMAKRRNVFHSVGSIKELMVSLNSSAVAENIQRGENGVQMLVTTLQGASINQANLMSSCFSECGSSMMLGRDGKLYLCQLFRG